jgi:aminoglycoside phosphotransferase (APT) family kinase protein
MTQRELIGRGRTADLVTWDGGRALKLFHEWVSAEAIEREARINRAVHAAGLPVPQVFDRVTLDGREGIVYERVQGPTLSQRMFARPWLITRYARWMADLHAAMHAARVDGLPSQRDRLRWKIEHADPLPDDWRAAALVALDRLPGGSAVCHGDFHPENILMAARGPLIIDWIDTTLGNPLADVARTALLLSTGESPNEGPVARWLSHRVRGVIHAAYVRRYCAQTGVTQAAIDAWALPVTAARLSEQIAEETERLLALIRGLVALHNPTACRL